MNIPFRETFLIHTGTYWNVILSDDQSFLGRCIVYLKTRETDDLMGLDPEEKQELWEEILPRLVKALKSSFQADRINYAHLANAIHHVHWHIVPRYEQNNLRTFADTTFTDERVGRNYLNVPEKTLPLPTMQAIIKEIQKHFS